MKSKLIRITTVPISLEKLLENQLTFMNKFYDVTAISSDKVRLEKFGKDNKVKVFNVEMTRVISPYKDFKSLFKMYLFFLKEKPQIVHSHTPKAGTIGILAAKLAGVPHRLHTVAGLPLLEAKGFKRILLNFVEKITYSAATKVFPNSFGLKDIILREKFCSKDKLQVIGNGSSNGINTEYFDISKLNKNELQKLRNDLSISDEDFVFVFVGRIVSDKGINELLCAFNKLTFSNVKLLLVGPKEPELDPLTNASEQLIIKNKNIIEVGYQSDIRNYLAISSALVFPSYREGFPNVVLQAGSFGLPSIVSDINGCNEIIINGYNGIIVPVKNKNILYESMIKLIEDKVLYATLTSNSRQRIVENYDQLVMWDKILTVYKSL
jgi:glycosyltransferase involved in cell wall biosynthesis